MDDELFLEQFEQRTLPFDQWTHRAHVKVAYLYLSKHPLPEAIDRVRAGILAYNAANDVPQTETVGYNETTTVAFMHLVSATMGAYGSMFRTKTADEFCDTHPQLLTKHILRLFYSAERRRESLGAAPFVEPDLAPLPRCEQGSP